MQKKTAIMNKPSRSVHTSAAALSLILQSRAAVAQGGPEAHASQCRERNRESLDLSFVMRMSRTVADK